jgi:hypothetical protein
MGPRFLPCTTTPSAKEEHFRLRSVSFHFRLVVVDMHSLIGGRFYRVRLYGGQVLFESARTREFLLVMKGDKEDCVPMDRVL